MRWAPAILLAILSWLLLATVIVAPLVLMLPPCPYEDSSNCIWDASKQGNGQGRSFVDIAGHVFYVP